MKEISKIDNHFLNKETTNTLLFIDPKKSDLIKTYGLNWFDKERIYQRFPKALDQDILNTSEGLFTLSKQATGASLAFYSNTTALKIKVKLGITFDMAHMAFTGQGGFDLYIGSDFNNLTFFKTSSYNILKKEYEFTFFDDFTKEMRLFILNFPLYAEVKDLEIGIDQNALITPALDIFNKGRVVIYGTSITQGGCASRPGMSFPSILSRKLGYEFLNFGFSGNGKGESIVAEALAKINDVKLFIIDYEANATLDTLKNTLDSFITILRKENPDVPILILSKIRMARETHLLSYYKMQEASLRYQKQIVKKHMKNDNLIFFLDGHRLLGKYTTEATVDGCHPTDLGFMMMSEYLEKYLKKVIKL